MARQTPSLPADPAPAEGYTVLARRYRPQRFAELVGQHAVAQALENAIKSDRVAHAYLFTGPRGVGKTSTARILAKCLNCEQGPTIQPCGVCASCKAITAGEDVDVFEMDAASNRGIDEARHLRSNVQYRPSRGRYKIYIIDEVHMLTREAFNALLKTLEEPPPHVKFILATTDAQKVPITILSRCQRFDFAGLTLPQIVGRLQDIVASEGREADPQALDLIARRAGGGMRDAQSLLDQLLSFGTEKLTAEQVYTLLGSAADDWVAELATAILAHNPAQALEALAELAGRGVQMSELVDQLLNYWRDLMVLNCAGEQVSDLNLPPHFRTTMHQQARAIPLDTILAGLDLLSSTRLRLVRSNHGRLLVEMALIRLARLEDLLPLTQLTQWVRQSGVAAGPPGAASPAPPPPKLGGLPAVEGVKKNGLMPPETGKNGHATRRLDEESLTDVWGQVLAQVGKFFAAQLEKAGLPAISRPNSLVLRFPVDYNQDRDYCSAPERVSKVEETLRKVTGEGWNFRVESSGVAISPSQVMNQPTAAAVREAEAVRTRRLKEEVEKEPIIKRAIELLGAQIVRIEEGFTLPEADATKRNESAEEA